MKTDYDLSISNYTIVHDDIWKAIWKQMVPNRLRKFVWLVRHALHPRDVVQSLSTLNFDDWLHRNIKGQVRCDFTQYRGATFIITLWCLWRWRNDGVFNNLKHPIAFKVALCKTQSIDIAKAFASTPIVGTRNQCYATRTVGWSAPL